MNDISIERFTRDFLLNEHQINVRFEPVNIRIKQLYQVYVKYQGREIRCHMQLGNNGFYITDPARLPEELITLESIFAREIDLS